MNTKHHHIHLIIALFAIILCSNILIGQDQKPILYGPPLTESDIQLTAKYPELRLPEAYRKKQDLPSELNNALLPFFRPNFSQIPYWNCGQSAAVGYGFTYEINRARNVSGNIPDNQYSVHFSFNFMNTGDGWGVSYFHSFDVLKFCGNPNLTDWGGLFDGGITKWMTGYDLYERAMHNRIRQVYSIDVSTEEGLMTLKHWLNDHLDGSEYGGVANFYLQSYNSPVLPEDSPEAGQMVIIHSYAPAGHAMTITGYNDSIRYDINGDGRYTNDVDLNYDGILDMKDWEIGGLRYMNSSTNNGGYGLIMYRTLALEYGDGGIWNNQVHVMDVKEDYEPLATMRVKIRHNSRNKLKLIAGVASDTSLNYPQHQIDFPIFNYQGGDHYMQGNDVGDTNKVLELSLDISSLLSYVESGKVARFFLKVAEKDKNNEGEGEILYFSIVDYQNGQSEISSSILPKIIENNNVTLMSLVSGIEYDPIDIVNDELLTIIPGEPSECQMSAQGGTPPYHWNVIQQYPIYSVENDFPDNRKELLEFDELNYTGILVDLPFEFPFYFDTLNAVTVNSKGFLSFNEEPFPYPYFIGEESMLKNTKMIAPYIAELVISDNGKDGVWVNNNEDNVEVVWVASFEALENTTEVTFAVRLFPDGAIETHYADMVFPDFKMWTSGVSYGDGENYTINTFNHHIGNHSNESYKYDHFDQLPDKAEIDQNGLLLVTIPDDSKLYSIVVQVTDDNGIIKSKNFQVPAEVLYEYLVESGIDDKINFFDTVSLSFTIRNISTNNYKNAAIQFAPDDSHFNILKDSAYIGNLNSGQTVYIDSVLLMIAEPGISDGYISNISCVISSDEKNYHSNVNVVAHSPDFKLIDFQVIDGNNGILEPGEHASFNAKITNVGHMDINNFEININAEESYLKIENANQTIDKLYVGETTIVSFNIEAYSTVPTGTLSEVKLGLYKEGFLVGQLKHELMIGRIPALILDLDPNQVSGLIISQLLDSLNLKQHYLTYYPDSYENYMSVFICLGKKFNNVEINPLQANKLSNFLVNGGMAYMEGQVTWMDDEPTLFHERFNISISSDGNYFLLDTIYGVANEFTADMSFSYSSAIPYNNYYLLPQESAFLLFNTGKNDSACVIANSKGNYKTIGSSVEFGNLVDTDSLSTRRNYLLEIVNFFGLDEYILSNDEFNYPNEEALNIHTYPNPFSERITIEFMCEANSKIQLRIFDLQGKVVYQQKSYKSKNTCQTIIWDATDETGKKLNKGLYFVQLKTKNHSLVSKIILQ